MLYKIRKFGLGQKVFTWLGFHYCASELCTHTYDFFGLGMFLGIDKGPRVLNIHKRSFEMLPYYIWDGGFFESQTDMTLEGKFQIRIQILKLIFDVISLFLRQKKQDWK